MHLGCQVNNINPHNMFVNGNSHFLREWKLLLVQYPVWKCNLFNNQFEIQVVVAYPPSH